MNQSILERLLDCIGEIEDFFLAEADTANISQMRATKRKRMVRYGAYGAAGLAVSVGAVAAVWKFRSNRIAKSA